MKTILYLNNRYCASKEDLQQVLGESKNHSEKTFRHEVLAAFKDNVMQKWCEERDLSFALDKIDISESDDDIFKAIVKTVTGRAVTADISSKFNEVGELIRVECNGRSFEDVSFVKISDMDAKSISFVFRSKRPENNKFKFTFNGVTKIVNWCDCTVNQEVAVDFPTPKMGEYTLKEGEKNDFGIKILFASDISVEVDGVKFLMKHVEGGSFTMGATSEQGGDAFSSETPAYTVTLSTFYIGETQVSQKVWRAVMRSNPSAFANGDNYPVEQVTWYDAVMFCNKLSEQRNMPKVYNITDVRYGDNGEIVSAEVSADFSKSGYRLPTEAEWEYAARGGQKSKGYKYSGSDDLGTVAWYESNSGGQTHSVQSKSPNELGIYDMTGNVWEWCQDWYDKDYYQKCKNNTELCNNPQGPSSGVSRVLRGGSWDNNADLCRVPYRGIDAPAFRHDGNVGFRLLLSSPKKEKEEK